MYLITILGNFISPQLTEKKVAIELRCHSTFFTAHIASDLIDLYVFFSVLYDQLNTTLNMKYFSVLTDNLAKRFCALITHLS